MFAWSISQVLLLLTFDNLAYTLRFILCRRNRGCFVLFCLFVCFVMLLYRCGVRFPNPTIKPQASCFVSIGFNTNVFTASSLQLGRHRRFEPIIP